MEYLHDVLVHHHIPEHFAGQPEGLKVAQFVHMPNVNQEGIPAVVQLHHLHKTAFPQPALKVHAQHRTTQDVGCASSQGLKTINVKRLAFLQRLSLLQIHQKLLRWIWFLEVALAGRWFEL
jgi:hypothetical protein